MGDIIFGGLEIESYGRCFVHNYIFSLPLCAMCRLQSLYRGQRAQKRMEALLSQHGSRIERSTL